MDAILQQLSQTIQNNGNTDRNAAECLAMREIILSGLSRSGFMKLFTYLPPFDSLKNNKLYLCFLDQDSQKNNSVRDFLPFADIELKASGVDAKITEDENGFTITTETVECVILLIREDFGLTPVYSYQQIPLPYELRSVSEMNEGARRKIEVIIDEKINGKKAEEKGKSAKSSGKGKRKKKEDNSVQQLSLFDF